jgi:ATP/maltotriose-dependent transcriptional regulator MalT
VRESGLVRRSAELQVLSAAWTAAVAGAPRVALVDGPAGIGKSALLGTFMSEVTEGHRIAWTGDEAETSLAFGMLGQLLSAHAGWADPFTAGRALLGHLGECTSQGAVIVCLDDLHLADRPSLVALNFAVRRLRHDPVLLVGSARTAHLAELPASLLRMSTDAGHRVTLAGLDAAAVQELAAGLGVGRLSPRAADRLCTLTGGSPLHLRALLREVPLDDLERFDRPLPAPASFAQLVLADLTGTSPQARQVASAAAVLGEHAELADLAAMADLDADALLLALEELERGGLMRLPADRTVARFEHPLVRAAIYADLGPAVRCRLHRRASGIRAGFLALQHRIAATVTTDPELAGDLEAWADDQASTGNLPAAATALLAAHRVTPPGDDADRRLLAGVELLTITGDVRSADEHTLPLAGMPESGRRLTVQARIAWLTGHDDDATALARRAWDRTDLTPEERDLVAETLCRVEIYRDNQAGVVEWADRALADGRLTPALASHTRAQRAVALALLGHPDQGLESLADLPCDPAEVDVARHPELSMRGYLKTWGGPPEAAQADLVVAASLGYGDLQPHRLVAAAGLAYSCMLSGDWDRNQATYQQVVDLAEDMDQIWSLGFLHADASRVPAARGDWATARQHLQAAQAMAARFGNLATHAYVEDATAFLGFCSGDPQAIVDATARLRATPEDSPQHDPAIFTWPASLVTALTELGHLDEAEAELAWVTRRCGDATRTRAVALRVTGQLAAARHDLGRARACLAEAVEMADDRVDALEQALALDAFGRFLRRRGERRAAVDRLAAARDRYVSLRAEPFLVRCAAELAACGVHDPAEAPVDPLTPQERAVATLVCAGRTNRQAADELVLSQKTIGYHLANTYTKLGVHSRAQLISAMQERSP